MIVSIKTIFAAISALVILAAYVPYFFDILKKKAKPHVFSWTTWGILLGLGFLLSLFGGGGWGAWVLGLESLLCFSVAAYAVFGGEKNITRTDWVAFVSALSIIAVYLISRNAIVSVFLAASVDAIGFIPTFRKSYSQPFAEPLVPYLLFCAGFLLSLGALAAYSFVTVFYPLTLAITCGTMTLFLFIRRRATGSI